MTRRPRPELRRGVILRQIDEDFAVYDPERDRTLLLNPSAAAILERCDGTRSVEEIAAEIASVFMAEQDGLLAQVEAALSEFAAQGLLEDCLT